MAESIVCSYSDVVPIDLYQHACVFAELNSYIFRTHDAIMC